MRSVFKVTLLLGVLLGAAQQRALAGGFQLDTHDARGTGRSFANTAGVDDSSAMYYNPAALSSFEKSSARGGFHYITYRIKYDPDIGEGAKARTQREHAILPHTYAALDLSEHVDLGLGVFVPFALATKWPKGWAGRYQALKNQVGFTFIEAAVSFKIPGADLGIAAGPTIIWQSSLKPVRLNRALDFRFLGEPDGELVIEGASDEVEVGYVVGVHWAPKEIFDGRVKIGAVWHDQPQAHEIEGEAEFRGTPALLNLPGEVDAKTDITLPGWFQAGIEVEVIEDTLWVEIDYKWTRWSTLDKLLIEFETTAVPPTALEFEWRDTHMVMAGVTIQPVEMFQLHFGYFYDQTPVPSKTLSPLLPDGDRNGVSMGVGLKLGPARFDVSYMHLFLDVARKNNELGGNLPGGPARANGNYYQSVDLVGASLGLEF